MSSPKSKSKGLTTYREEIIEHNEEIKNMIIYYKLRVRKIDGYLEEVWYLCITGTE